MNRPSKFLLACIPALLVACGGAEDALSIADPTVRFVDASASAPNLTLYRDTAAQGEATDVGYKFASDYYNVPTSFADWSVRNALSGATVDSASIDPARGTKYTIIALPTSALATGIYVIADPYNKAIGSNSTRLRVANGRFGAPAIDVYMNAVGTDIATAGVNPLIAATAANTSGPAAGTDSVDIPAGTWQVTIAAAGTKTVLFQGKMAFGDNQDILLVVLHDNVVPGMAQTLFKVEGTGGLNQIPTM